MYIRVVVNVCGYGGLQNDCSNLSLDSVCMFHPLFASIVIICLLNPAHFCSRSTSYVNNYTQKCETAYWIPGTLALYTLCMQV